MPVDRRIARRFVNVGQEPRAESLRLSVEGFDDLCAEAGGRSTSAKSPPLSVAMQAFRGVSSDLPAIQTGPILGLHGSVRKIDKFIALSLSHLLPQRQRCPVQSSASVLFEFFIKKHALMPSEGGLWGRFAGLDRLGGVAQGGLHKRHDILLTRNILARASAAHLRRVVVGQDSARAITFHRFSALTIAP